MPDSNSSGWKAIQDLASLWRASSAADLDGPGMARTDNRSEAVRRRANELAASAVEEDAARDELRRLAGRRRKTLERAEKSSRLGRRHRESENPNRAWRLLLAALLDQPVQPITAEDHHRILALDRAIGADRTEQEIWEELCMREPRLSSLLRDVRARRFGADNGLLPPTSESSKGALRLIAALKRLLGPLSGSTDQIIESERAHGFALRYLLRQRPRPTDARTPESQEQ